MLIKKLFYFRPLFDAASDAAGGAGTLTAEEQAAADAKAAEDKAASDKKAADDATAAAEAAKIAAVTDPKIAAMNEKIDEQTKLLNTLIEKVDPASKPNVWTIDKLEDAEAKCHSGEYDMKYLPKITTMKSLLLARQVATETTTQLTKEQEWANTQALWDKGLSDAKSTFGEDVADTNSKLFKTAQTLLHQDPGFKRYNELKSSGVNPRSIDPKLIDPNLQFKCFEIAASRLGIKRNDAPDPTVRNNGRKIELGGRDIHTDKTGQSLLDQLEAKAVASGEQRDWINLDKERIKQRDEVRRGR